MNRIRGVPGERAAPSSAGKALIFVLPGLWTGSVVALGYVVPGRVHVVQLLAAAPAIACAGSGRRRCVLVGGACALIALFPLSGSGRLPGGFESEFGHVLAIFSVIGASYLITGRRVRLTDELERVREVALAAQRVLLRPLPRQVEALAVAGDYLSASRGAQIGGDLYEVLATPYGVRVVLGDVRGHGLSAVGTVAALLGCFREAAHDEAELAGVLGRLDRALARHLRERAGAGHQDAAAGESGVPLAEEFVTVLLVELRADGEMSVLNCGHPWPYLIDAAPGRERWARPLSTVEAMPPLGVLDAVEARPTGHQGRLRPGQTLFLHTDGAEEARDVSRSFFPLAQVLETAARYALADGVLDPELLVSAVRAALMEHVDDRLADDVAMLALSHGPGPGPLPAPRGDGSAFPAAGAQL